MLTFDYSRMESCCPPKPRFSVDPQRVLKFWNEGLTLEQISRKFVGISVHDVRPALEYALAGPVPKRNPAPIPPDIPRCTPSPLCVQEVETLANKLPKFGNTLHDLRRACDKIIVAQFTEFLAAGYGPWNGESNVRWLTLESVRNSLRRSGRPDLWEKIDPYQGKKKPYVRKIKPAPRSAAACAAAI